jgi:hypothetical protein
MWIIENSLPSKSVWITAMAPLKLRPKSETDPSRMSVLMEMKETVETMEGVLVKMTEVGLGDSDGVTTVVDDGTCNKGERTVRGRDGDDAETDMDTIAVNVKEGDKEEEGILDSDSLEGLSSIVLSRLGS